MNHEDQIQRLRAILFDDWDPVGFGPLLLLTNMMHISTVLFTCWQTIAPPKSWRRIW